MTIAREILEVLVVPPVSIFSGHARLPTSCLLNVQVHGLIVSTPIEQSPKQIADAGDISADLYLISDRAHKQLIRLSRERNQYGLGERLLLPMQ